MNEISDAGKEPQDRADAELKETMQANLTTTTPANLPTATPPSSQVHPALPAPTHSQPQAPLEEHKPQPQPTNMSGPTSPIPTRPILPLPHPHPPFHHLVNKLHNHTTNLHTRTLVAIKRNYLTLNPTSDPTEDSAAQLLVRKRFLKDVADDVLAVVGLLEGVLGENHSVEVGKDALTLKKLRANTQPTTLTNSSSSSSTSSRSTSDEEADDPFVLEKELDSLLHSPTTIANSSDDDDQDGELMDLESLLAYTPPKKESKVDRILGDINLNPRDHDPVHPRPSTKFPPRRDPLPGKSLASGRGGTATLPLRPHPTAPPNPKRNVTPTSTNTSATGMPVGVKKNRSPGSIAQSLRENRDPAAAGAGAGGTKSNRPGYQQKFVGEDKASYPAGAGRKVSGSGRGNGGGLGGGGKSLRLWK